MLYPDRIFTKVTTNFLQNNLNPDDIYSDTKRLSRFYYERHIRYKNISGSVYWSVCSRKNRNEHYVSEYARRLQQHEKVLADAIIGFI